MSSPANPDSFSLYAITDRRALPDGDLNSFLKKAVAAGIDMIQIREKDLTDRELFALTLKAVEISRDGSTRVLVNDRIDVALAASADGVHLGGHSAPTAAVREAVPSDFLIGVSTHNRDEAATAASGGADFITFGPVFHTASKAQYGPPKGLQALREVCLEFPLPVLPLGGINEDTYRQLLGLPIAGVAAISLFQKAENLDELSRRLRDEFAAQMESSK